MESAGLKIEVGFKSKHYTGGQGRYSPPAPRAQHNLVEISLPCDKCDLN